jgi:outer membrane protein TolC
VIDQSTAIADRDRKRSRRTAQPEIELSSDSSDPDQIKPTPVTIDDLVAVAVRLSPDLARARVDRYIASEESDAARKHQAWVVTSGAQYKRMAIGYDVDVKPFDVVAQQTIEGMLGLGRKLPTGGSLEVGVGLSRTEQELDIQDYQVTKLGEEILEYEFIDQTKANAHATITQPILRGFGSDSALAPQRKADLGAVVGTLRAQISAEELIRDLVKGYWEVAFASFELDVRIESLDLAKKQETTTREELRAGTVAASAINAVQYQLAVREEAVLRARQSLAKKSLELRRRSGLEIGRRDMVLAPSEPFEIAATEWAVEDVLEKIRTSNRQVAALRLDGKIAEVEVDAADDATRPQLDLKLTGALIGYGDSADESLASMRNADSYEVTLGLSLSFEVSGAAAAARDAARARRRKVDIDREDLERTIETTAVDAVQSVDAARTRVTLAERAIAVANENVKAERANFLVGRSNNFQVLERQEELVDAHLRRGRAIADYHVAVAELEFLAGMLLDHYRVDVRAR